MQVLASTGGTGVARGTLTPRRPLPKPCTQQFLPPLRPRRAASLQKTGIVMDLRPINETYSVAGQISAGDLEAIKAAGFKSIVCHRPDGEAPDQPGFDSVKQAAEALGLEVRHIPIGPMGVTADAVREMVDAIEEMPQPMLGYCRSGARSTAVYQHTAHLRG